ncbi:fibrobacter succinogenes major paralogous domain-containing protein [uncultured Fibrobacter sp.]|uniref:fibrobacter succinogenes major paralogous domain-containing protein n=1 Tax=uncultured Fibrobacter sp. TaxID=261512 RepID=UPI002620A365|nr:fibrobacter succinogenes major paralogous domain-containing protein [uncultured Fibrobacter sp.]
MKKWILPAFALGSFFMVACSDGKDTAGTSEESEGITAIKDLNVAGTAQKGPFVKGSAVTVQGIDCKTLNYTGEVFDGAVKSDKGDFAVDDVTLSASCAVFAVTGKYRSEITGKESASEITLHALTDLRDRESVNINVLTELEYERVMHLVNEEGKTFADAKALAEKEVLAAFSIAGDFDNSEDLTIFENGDGNAALLAVSVLMLAETDDAGLAKRIEKFADSFAETGEWNDDKTKATIEKWQVAATTDGTLDSIRKNIESWGYADVVPAFEKYVEVFGNDVVPASSGNLPSSSSSTEGRGSSSSRVDPYLNPNIDYGEMTDSRDGKVYKTLKIGNQVWMAENLNYEADGSRCYNDSAEYCAKYGRLYPWGVAMDSMGKWSTNGKGCGMGSTCSPTYPVRGVCPSGWHLPTKAEWETLFTEVGGSSVAGNVLKDSSSWDYDADGTDDFGFSALPAGSHRYDVHYEGFGKGAYFLTSTEYSENSSYSVLLDYRDEAHFYSYYKFYENSVRCVMDDDGSVPESSSSSAVSSSSSSWVPWTEADSGSTFVFDLSVPKEAYLNPDIQYGTLVDSRDAQTYKTVQIGDLVWMAENLNYASEGSACFNDTASYCELFGRLYYWSTAMDSAGTWSDHGKGCGYNKTCTPTYPVRGICPEGWHLPSAEEFNKLIDAVGGLDSASRKLMSPVGWYDHFMTAQFHADNSTGFSAIASGGKTTESGFWGLGRGTGFFSSTEFNVYNARNMSLYPSEPAVGTTAKKGMESVRCVKD